MKKVFLLAVGVLMTLMASAKTLYLNTGGNDLWSKDGAVFGVHSWGSGAYTDKLMVSVSGNTYKADVPNADNSIIFVRFNNGTTSFNWDNKWSETATLSIPSDKDYYTITGWSYGNWSVYDSGSGGGGGGGGSIVADGWSLRGEFNEWKGDANKFATKTGGEENTLYTTRTLEAGKEYAFKVVATTGGTDTWLDDGNGGAMTQAHCTGWKLKTGGNEYTNIRLVTTIKGNYEFVLNTSAQTISVVYPSNPKQATLYESAIRENNPDVMIQAFYWAHEGSTNTPFTKFGDVNWSHLIAESGDLAKYFDLVWLAPSQETADYTGYLPMNYSKQGTFDEASGHHGHSPWGTAQELRSLIDNLHHGGAKVVADIVLNHTSAGHVDEYKGSDKNWCSWTLNDFGQYGKFQIETSWITAEDEMFANDRMDGRIDSTVTGDCGKYDKSKLTPDDKIYSYNGGSQWDYQEYNSIYSRDLAHAKKEVREMSHAYLAWMRDSIGYDGFRWDFMKGISGGHLFDYLRSSAPYFSVAEVFEGNIDKQLAFLNDANHATYMFDFPGKFTIYNEAIGIYQLQKLKGNQYTLLFGDNKRYAVSFIDNHDSFREKSNMLGEEHKNELDDMKSPMALAYLLSMPGVPCVLYPYWNNYKDACVKLITARKSAGVHSESVVDSEEAGDGTVGKNFYKARIAGTKGYLYLKLGYDAKPNEAPAASLAGGKTWKLAWAGEHAGVWYTGDDWTPYVPTDIECQNVEMPQAQATKFIQNGVMYIQRGNEIYNAQGLRIQ